MKESRVAILYGHGINCDRETLFAMEQAVALREAEERVKVERVHTNDFIDSPRNLRDYSMLIIPGGFLHADDISAGQILAGKLKTHLAKEIDLFIDEGKLILGICNGFQVLSKYPVFGSERTFTLTANDCGRFQDRWVNLRVNPDSPCIYLRGIDQIPLPVRHAEGKFVADRKTLDDLRSSGRIALQYADGNGNLAQREFPANPNGSLMDVAGVCDSTGRIFGLMPHPEAFVSPFHYPGWPSARRGAIEVPQNGAGIKIFTNAVDYLLEEM